ncbi:hypothetical protein BD779DRAFT_1666643 [Infundibulicybe gibba]|nr:hypothetical protein BD779DRAFT_1666643 [Infundibulicybe gibba]
MFGQERFRSSLDRGTAPAGLHQPRSPSPLLPFFLPTTMLQSLNSPQEDHLRNLLGQRTTRAHLHSRFPSVSDISDSPSVYSRAFLSPRPMDRSDSCQSDYHHIPPLSPADRTHKDRLNDPTASMLDLDDDSRSSFDSSEAYEEEDQVHFDDDDDEPMPRMSILGPKMRYHSRAPWEMDEGSLPEEDELELGSTDLASPNHTKENVFKRGFGFSSSSPRSSNAGRPSGESSRSQSRSKTSSEAAASHSSNSRGICALAHENLSSSAPSPVPNPAQKVPRGKFSLGLRTRSPKHSVPSSPNPSVHGHLPPATTHLSDPQFSPRCFTNEQIHQHQVETQSFKSPRPSDSYVDEDVHPYANPDLAVSYAQEPPPSSPLRVFDDFSHLSRSDSAITVTDSIATSTASKTASLLTADTSAASMSRDAKGRVSVVNGREISFPLSLHNSTLLSETPTGGRESGSNNTAPIGVFSLHGWMDRGMGANVALISLEEARAQRSRSITTPNAPPPRHSESSTSLHTPPYDSQPDSTSITNSFDDSPISSINSRARARSISAGARAKNALQTIVSNAAPQSRFERRDSEPAIAPPGKSLKHKKSGFMRLFNSARDKEERAPPPPVPSLSDAHAAHNAQQQAPRISSRRIPAPRLSPSLLDVRHSDKDSDTTTLRSSPSPKRTPPPLSIQTRHQVRVPIAPSSATEDSAFQPQTAPPDPAERMWNHLDSFAQSAPPNVTEFPALKLRPMSTMFSAQFEDIVQRDPPPTSDSDVQSPLSAKELISPITPSHQDSRSGQFQDKQPMLSIPEDQSSVIRALQEQVATAKTAWQRQIWELEGQVRDLKAEVEDLRTASNEKDFCDVCGRGGRSRAPRTDRLNEINPEKPTSILSRPRARTGTSSRFGSATS